LKAHDIVCMLCCSDADDVWEDIEGVEHWNDDRSK